MALFEFKLPDIGEGVMEGEIVKWLVKAGDVIKEDAPLVDLMTDKATVTVPSPVAGTIVRTHGAVGAMAKVHHPLVDVEVAGAVPAQAGPTHGAPAKTAPQAVAQASAAAPVSAEKVLATPVTRRMAREHGIDLGAVAGTGPQGRVLKTDIEAHLAGGAPKSVGAATSTRAPMSYQAVAANAADQRIPLKGLRKKIAEKMVRSKFTAPHYAFVEELDASELVALRARLNDTLAKGKDSTKLSFLPFFIRAVLAAFKKFPQVNANMDEVNQELVVRGEFNIGVAAMTEQGLTVPVVRHADRHGVLGLANEVSRLATAAREQRLKLEELTGGTFTITSLGQTGGLFATPIINHPEVAIMGVHRMRKRAMVLDDDRIVVRPVMLLSFCFDHRVIDGATGAEFAYEVLKYLEHPENLFLA
jgi:pyruvate dehydrogenase E2 component (dihydrolipoamide acetyltransferase)